MNDKVRSEYMWLFANMHALSGSSQRRDHQYSRRTVCGPPELNPMHTFPTGESVLSV